MRGTLHVWYSTGPARGLALKSLAWVQEMESRFEQQRMQLKTDNQAERIELKVSVRKREMVRITATTPADCRHISLTHPPACAAYRSWKSI